jgi:hypothetical protein
MKNENQKERKLFGVQIKTISLKMVFSLRCDPSMFGQCHAPIPSTFSII